MRIFGRVRWEAATLLSLYVVCIGTGCGVIPKQYPINQPFVYQTNIQVQGNFTNTEKNRLSARLKGQLDDSLRVRPISKLFYSELKQPPRYDPNAAKRSITYMRNLLVAEGYHHDSIRVDTTSKRTSSQQIRTTVVFQVWPGKPVQLDTIRYQFSDSNLQQLALSHADESFLQLGAPFAKTTISQELSRLVNLFRNHGYLRFGREDLLAIWDTLDRSVLTPTLDPFEELSQLERLRARKETPKANLEWVLREGLDPSKLICYKVGTLTIHPDLEGDETIRSGDTTYTENLTVVSRRNLFIPRMLEPNIYLHPGDKYDQRNYTKTINRLNALGTWRLVNIDQIPRPGSDTTDFLIRMIPGKKGAFQANIEGSNNQSILSGNLFGLAVNVGFQNRNVARRAIQSSTNLRYGVEAGRDTVTDVRFIQTQQISLSHNLYFPRAVPALRWIPDTIRDNFRSILSISASNTERRSLVNVTNLNAAWGYDFRIRNTLFTFRLPNIELSFIKKREKLEELIDSNALLKNIFADGLIFSGMAGASWSKQTKNRTTNVRINVEESGLLTGMVRNKFLDSNLLRFIKLDVDLAHKIQFKKSSLALHLFAGTGYELNSTVNPLKRSNLPLFRQYFAGGPNSMRAWSLRKLGPGSSIQDFGNRGLPERYGDMQLEANAEYRFPFFRFAGFDVQGALFTDVGNVWYLKQAPGRDEKEIFSLQRIGKDLAVGIGTGLRIDFSFFVVRLDYSYKAKDPSPTPANANAQNKWFGYKKWSDADQFQLGISYPFIL
ncbi:MAG: BamA/TamA family outer membrane protein [Bacteroidota bacterium]